MSTKRTKLDIPIIFLASVACIFAALVVIAGGAYFFANRQPTNDQEAIVQEFVRVMAPVTKALPPDETLVIQVLNIEGTWATAETTVIDKNTGEYTLGEGTIIIFKKLGNHWQGERTGTDTYKEWLDQIPPSLISQDLKNWLR